MWERKNFDRYLRENSKFQVGRVYTANCEVSGSDKVGWIPEMEDADTQS